MTVICSNYWSNESFESDDIQHTNTDRHHTNGTFAVRSQSAHIHIISCPVLIARLTRNITSFNRSALTNHDDVFSLSVSLSVFPSSIVIIGIDCSQFAINRHIAPAEDSNITYPNMRAFVAHIDALQCRRDLSYSPRRCAFCRGLHCRHLPTEMQWRHSRNTCAHINDKLPPSYYSRADKNNRDRCCGPFIILA